LSSTPIGADRLGTDQAETCIERVVLGFRAATPCALTAEMQRRSGLPSLQAATARARPG
jgi:hypothetical protein